MAPVIFDSHTLHAQATPLNTMQTGARGVNDAACDFTWCGTLAQHSLRKHVKPNPKRHLSTMTTPWRSLTVAISCLPVTVQPSPHMNRRALIHQTRTRLLANEAPEQTHPPLLQLLRPQPQLPLGHVQADLAVLDRLLARLQASCTLAAMGTLPT